MTGGTQPMDLNERLKLIETMIAEGRSSTESWGWTFLLWGVAYYAATAWASWGRSSLAWPVTMTAACVVTFAAHRWTRSGRPRTAAGRAIGSVWAAMGVTLFLLMFSLGASGRLDLHVALAIVGGALAIANGASGLILKWKMQVACAVVWLAAAETACFGSDSECLIAFLAATFLCQIVFGVYAMIQDSRRRRRLGAVHA